MYDGQYGRFDKQKAPSVKFSGGKFNRDRAALFEVLPETAILVQKVKWNQAEDDLASGVRQILQDTEVPISFWAVFAASYLLTISRFSTPVWLGRASRLPLSAGASVPVQNKRSSTLKVGRDQSAGQPIWMVFFGDFSRRKAGLL